MKLLYQFKEVAEMTGRHPCTITDWADRGIIETFEARGGRRYIPRREVLRMAGELENPTET